ncbi:MAG: CarD family transcriptional regulator [Emergencia sp.]
MYEIDDLIMYGSTGVCRVCDITKPDFAAEDEDKLYYVLEPLYQSGVIYAPVDNEKVFMRPVITESEAKDLIDNIPKIHTEIYKNSSMQQLTKYYQSVIDTHKCSDLLKLTKSIHQKKVDAMKQNRHLGQIDKKFMKRAEDLLFGEFAAALKISRDDVQTYIIARLEADE